MFRAERILLSRYGASSSRASSSSLLMKSSSAVRGVSSPSFPLIQTPSMRFLSTASASPSVSAALVKDLREKTGAPMMECKKALMDNEVQGDINKAIDWLRAKGIAKASSQTNRISVEGLVGVLQRPPSGVTLVEVNSETGEFPLLLPFSPLTRFRCSEPRLPKVCWFSCCLHQPIARKWGL
jgi:hypothetical protein